MFTCSEVCIAADNAKHDPEKLTTLIVHIKDNEYYYKQHEYLFMVEHIENYLNIFKRKLYCHEL